MPQLTGNGRELDSGSAVFNQVARVAETKYCGVGL